MHLAYMINVILLILAPGKNVTNDNTLTIQANEVTEPNNAKALPAILVIQEVTLELVINF